VMAHTSVLYITYLTDSKTTQIWCPKYNTSTKRTEGSFGFFTLFLSCNGIQF